MSDDYFELMSAARTLLQWGRVRQGAWHDASADLLAALGNRHAAFAEMAAHAPADPPPRPPLEASVPPHITPPAPIPPGASESGQARRPTASPPVNPPPGTTAAITALAPLAPVRSGSPVHVPQPGAKRPPTTAARPVRRVTTPAPPTPRRGWRIAAAIVVVLAGVAAPRVWDAYRTVVPPPQTTNQVTFASTPPGIAVLVNGVESGRTPLTLTLALGSHAVEYRHRKAVRRLELDVTAGAPMTTTVEWNKRSGNAKKKPAKPAAKNVVSAPASAPAAAQ